jgi:hypothetical protein
LRISSRLPGLAGTRRESWLDPQSGDVRWTQAAPGGTRSETLVAGGRFSLYLPSAALLVVGPVCDDLAEGCGEVIDPVASYRQALLEGRANALRTTLDGRPAYRIVVPMRALLGGLLVDQVVIVDASTYLPRRIEWRELRLDGFPHLVASIDVEEIERVSRSEAPAGTFQLDVPPNASVVQRAAPGQPLFLERERPLTVAEARGVTQPLLWLGPSYRGVHLTAIDETEWNAGTAVALRYGGITVWNYTDVVPPDLLPGVLARAKAAVGAHAARLYETPDGRRVAEVERSGYSVAVVAAAAGVDPLRAVAALRELR